MTIHRRAASRDANEAQIITALRTIGRHVTAISGSGVPDLLVIRPGRELPIFVCETIDQAIYAAMTDDLVLIEVKGKGKKLTPSQRLWHAAVGLEVTR